MKLVANIVYYFVRTVLFLFMAGTAALLVYLIGWHLVPGFIADWPESGIGAGIGLLIVFVLLLMGGAYEWAERRR